MQFIAIAVRRRQGHPRRRHRGAVAAGTAHHPVRGRGAPLQQGSQYFLNQILTRLIVQYLCFPMVQRREAMSDLFAQEPSAPLAEPFAPRPWTRSLGSPTCWVKGSAETFPVGQTTLHDFLGPPGVEKQHLHVSRPLHSSASSSPCRRSCLVLKTSEKQWNKQGSLVQGKNTILFVDEIHRFNKSQQDALLPHVESGLFTFIGATTENPSFEVNSALLSRAQVYVLKSLTDEVEAAAQASTRKALGDLEFEDKAVDTIVGYADGDARRFLNLLEQCKTAAGAAEG